MKKVLLSAAFVAAVMVGCSKDQATNNNGGEERDGQWKVGFSAGVDQTGGLSTRALANPTTSQPIAENVKATIFAYADGADVTQAATLPIPCSPMTYAADALAELKGKVDGSDKLFLSPATYDFYAVSKNNADEPDLTFTNGISDQTLENGVDYLWVKKSHDVTAADNNVPLVFKRLASKVKIVVKRGSGVKDFDNTSAKIKPTDVSGSSINLSDGDIPMAAGITAGDDVAMIKTIQMNGDSLWVTPQPVGGPQERDSSRWVAVMEYIMLPMAGNVTLTGSITTERIVGVAAVAEEQTYNMAFNTPNTAPNVGFESGKQYIYHATISATGIVFEDVVVEDWQDVDMTNGGTSDIDPDEHIVANPILNSTTVKMFAFGTGDMVAQAIDSANVMYTAAQGKLNPVAPATTMELTGSNYTEGTFVGVNYDFFAFAPSNLVFTAGEVALADGIDYMWFKESNKAVNSSSSQNLALVMAHKGTKIVLNVAPTVVAAGSTPTANDIHSIASLEEVKIVGANLAPANAKFALNDGFIPQLQVLANQPANLRTMVITGKKATYNYLPIATSQNVAFSVKAKVYGYQEDAANPGTYTTTRSNTLETVTITGTFRTTGAGWAQGNIYNLDAAVTKLIATVTANATPFQPWNTNVNAVVKVKGKVAP